MRFAITFGTISPKYWLEAGLAADEAGFESVWLPEHLVLPIDMAGSPFQEAEHPPIPPDTTIHDAISFLSYLAAKTQQIRLGTYVTLLGIRHPFTSARGWATLDILSSGRAILGAGAGWLESEWIAAGIDPATRGKRLDEAIAICRQLWTEPVVEFHGDAFDFGPVAFEPKPHQRPIPIHIGGEGPRAIRRAATLGDGWLGMEHTPESALALVRRLEDEVRQADRSPESVEVTVSGSCTAPNDVEAWEKAGVDRLIVRPWHRSAEAPEAIAAFRSQFAEFFDHT